MLARRRLIGKTSLTILALSIAIVVLVEVTPAPAAQRARVVAAKRAIGEAYSAFASGVAAGDGPRTCALLTPSARAQLVREANQDGTAGSSCEAVVSAQATTLPAPAVRDIRIYGIRAAGRTDSTFRLFSRGRRGWRVAESAATNVLADSAPGGRRAPLSANTATSGEGSNHLRGFLLGALAVALTALLALAWHARQLRRRAARLQWLLEEARMRTQRSLNRSIAATAGDSPGATLERENHELAARLTEAEYRARETTSRLLAELTAAAKTKERVADLEQTIARSEAARADAAQEIARLSERLRLLREPTLDGLTWERNGSRRRETAAV